MRVPRLVAILLGIAGLVVPAATAREPADDLLLSWASHVGQKIDVAGCFLTSAQLDNVYCDTEFSGRRLYIDIASLDGPSLKRAIADCPDSTLRPECKVTLTGTMQASFGSPMLVDAVADFEAYDDAPAVAPAGVLPAGEYACYGSGGTILAGLGFILAADGSYTDLDRTVSGMVRVADGSVAFEGGHLDGEVGRDLSARGSFVVGELATCEPW